MNNFDIFVACIPTPEFNKHWRPKRHFCTVAFGIYPEQTIRFLDRNNTNVDDAILLLFPKKKLFRYRFQEIFRILIHNAWRQFYL